MKLLVTGGSGFLGRRTVEYFKNLGWQVFAPGHGQLDITEEAVLRNWFQEHQPEAVIHTAAISDTGACQRNPEWSERINVAGTVNLARVCRDYGAKLVICSSDQVYSGSPVSGPHRESEVLVPDTVYGNQKLRAEQLCLELLPETVCLRLSWMYTRKDCPGDRGHFLTILKSALEDETKPLTWSVHDRRGLTDVEDVLRNLPAALKLPGGSWNFGAENDRSTYATVKTVLEELGMEAALRRLQPNEEAFREKHRDLSMDSAKGKSAGLCFPSTKESLKTALEAAFL